MSATAADVLAGRATWSCEVGDAGLFLGDLPNPSVDLVFGSPPYATKAGRYPGLTGPALPPNDPREWAQWMLTNTLRAAASCRGYVVWVVNSPTGKQGEYLPAVERLLVSIDDSPLLVLRRPQVWHKNGPPGPPNYPGNDHEAVVVCHQRGRRPHYDALAIGTVTKFDSGAFRQRKADGTRAVTTRTKKKGTPARPRDVVRVTVGGRQMGRVNPDGKVDLEDDCLACQGEAPFPWKLAAHFVRGYSPPGGVVCDPFAGSGTTCLAAVMHRRRFAGCDVRQSQVDLCARRMAGVTTGMFA